MKEPKYKSIVIIPHNKDCKSEWSGITDGSFYGNFNANPFARNRGHLWYRVLCNNTSCIGIKAVHCYVLANS